SYSSTISYSSAMACLQAMGIGDGPGHSRTGERGEGARHRSPLDANKSTWSFRNYKAAFISVFHCRPLASMSIHERANLSIISGFIARYCLALSVLPRPHTCATSHVGARGGPRGTNAQNQ